MKKLKFRQTLRSKIVAILLVIALVPMIGIAIVSYGLARNALEQLSLRELTLSNDAVSDEVRNFLHQFESDLLGLSQNPATLGLMRAQTNSGIDPLSGDTFADWTERLEQTFVSVSQNKKFYQQLRYLDKNGIELVRVDYNPATDQVRIVPAEDLQDKSDRYYFVETMVLNQGEVFISPLDLNRERDQIQRPFVPVIRYGTPIFDENGERQGMIISNVFANSFLFRLHTEAAEAVGTSIFLTNQAGFYLHNTDSSQEFGFELNLPFNAFDDFSWALGNLDTQDSFVDVNNEQEIALVATKINFDTNNPDRYWLLMRSTSTAVILNDINTLGNIILLSVIVVALLVVFIAFWLASSITWPLTTLTLASEQLSRGQWDTKMPTDRNDEIGHLALSLRQMADQLRDVFNNLEVRIEDRTRALETSTEISRQLTTILDLDELLQYVVSRIQLDFGFYHTHIYLLDENSNELIMAEGSGAVGKQLKERGHRLRVGRGLVGTVAENKEPFLADNVDNIPNFFRNPLLPDTQSELAVPIKKGDKLLGVLDNQSDVKNGFSPQDLSVIQSIADQLAVAIDNARLLQETKKAVLEAEMLNRRLTREAWEDTKTQVERKDFIFARPGLSDRTGKNLQPILLPAIRQKSLSHIVKPGNGKPGQRQMAAPLTLRGEVIGVIGIESEEGQEWTEDELTIVQSVADQVARALENARLAKEQEKTIEELKDIDRIKSEFLTSMSHELRTPLNSIIGFADVLIQGIDGELPEMALGDVKLIHNSGQHLLALINDILDLSKIEAGKLELVTEPMAIGEVIDEVVGSSSSLFNNKPVELQLELEQAHEQIMADHLRINQILLNLVSNASKFTEEGTVIIKSYIPETQPNVLRISVIDTGIGIAADNHKAVFDRFRQADNSTTRKYGGTGLGLAICKQLVELHGGEIGLNSVEGEGSEFYFTIPLATEKELLV